MWLLEHLKLHGGSHCILRHRIQCLAHSKCPVNIMHYLYQWLGWFKWWTSGEEVEAACRDTILLRSLPMKEGEKDCRHWRRSEVSSRMEGWELLLHGEMLKRQIRSRWWVGRGSRSRVGSRSQVEGFAWEGARRRPSQKQDRMKMNRDFWVERRNIEEFTWDSLTYLN